MCQKYAGETGAIVRNLGEVGLRVGFLATFAPSATSSAHLAPVFKSTVYETEHPVVQLHPLTGERAIVLGSFVRRLLGVSSAESAHLLAMLQDNVTRLENMVRWR